MIAVPVEMRMLSSLQRIQSVVVTATTADTEGEFLTVHM